MTVEEFEKKFAELTKKHDELEKKFDKLNDNPDIDIDEAFDKQFELLIKMSDSIDQMSALLDKAMEEAENE